jgi:hypothetical protein
MEKEYFKIKDYIYQYRIIWVNEDYEIQETSVEAENKRKAIVEFVRNNDISDLVDFKVKRID